MPSFSGIWTLPAQLQAKAQGLWVYVSSYFQTILQNSSTTRISLFADGVVQPSAGVFCAGQANEASNPNGSNLTVGILAKYTATGTVSAQKRFFISLASSSNFLRAITVDGGGNIYVAGAYLVSGNYRVYVARLNSSFAIQWQTTLDYGTSFGASFTPNSINLDPFGNVVVGIRGTFSGCPTDYYETCAKFSSSGTLLFSTATILSTSVTAGISKSDSLGNTFMIAGSKTVNSFREAYLARLNSSGAITATYGARAVGVVSDFTFDDFALDSLNNIYVAGSYSGNLKYIGELSSSGVLQWGISVSGTSGFRTPYMCVDNQGNTYTALNTSSAQTTLCIVKVNGSGTVQWQRQLTAAGAVIEPQRINFDSATGIIISGRIAVSGVLQSYTIVLPDDGSRTGTYTTAGVAVTYAVSSALSFSPIGLNAIQGTVTASSLPPTSPAVSISITDISYNSSTTVI